MNSLIFLFMFQLVVLIMLDQWAVVRLVFFVLNTYLCLASSMNLDVMEQSLLVFIHVLLLSILAHFHWLLHVTENQGLAKQSFSQV